MEARYDLGSVHPVGTAISFALDMTTAASGQGVSDALTFLLLTADGLTPVSATRTTEIPAPARLLLLAAALLPTLLVARR